MHRGMRQARPRLEVIRLRKRNWILLASLASILLVAMLSLAALLLSGWLTSGFVPKHVLVRGAMVTPAEEVLANLQVGSGSNAFAYFRNARILSGSDDRWITSARARMGWGRTMVVDIEERLPLLKTRVSDRDYWLCSDQALVEYDAEEDQGAVYEAIGKLPRVKMPLVDGSRLDWLGEAVITAAASCHQALPGEIKLIEITSDHEMVLYDSTNFPIHLGQPVELPRKIGALEKALRICRENKDGLLYLDASDPMVFYQKWSAPQT